MKLDDGTQLSLDGARLIRDHMASCDELYNENNNELLQLGILLRN
jgi:hypothetical protein